MKISHLELTIDPTLAESFDDLVGGEFDVAGRELTRQYVNSMKIIERKRIFHRFEVFFSFSKTSIRQSSSISLWREWRSTKVKFERNARSSLIRSLSVLFDRKSFFFVSFSLLSKRIRRKDLALILIVEFFHQCQITTISSVVQTLVEAAGRFNFENVSILIDRIEIATISFQTVGVNNVRTSREENRWTVAKIDVRFSTCRKTNQPIRRFLFSLLLID